MARSIAEVLTKRALTGRSRTPSKGAQAPAPAKAMPSRRTASVPAAPAVASAKKEARASARMQEMTTGVQPDIDYSEEMRVGTE